MSLDALHGFDMFWITGGAMIFRAFTARNENGVLLALRLQFEHLPWEGFRFYDLIFPLFLFMIGVAIPFALSKRLAGGDRRWRIYGHILLRVVILVFFGMLINGNLLSYKPHQFTISYSVLQMLALGYLVASILWLNRWTSTFALGAGGWSYLLLALFYLLIDVWHLRRWAFPFVVIGANSIFAYMACGLCNGAFKAVADRFLGGLATYTGPWQEGISWTGTFLVLWLLLYYLYRNKTFLRV